MCFDSHMPQAGVGKRAEGESGHFISADIGIAFRVSGTHIQVSAPVRLSMDIAAVPLYGDGAAVAPDWIRAPSFLFLVSNPPFQRPRHTHKANSFSLQLCHFLSDLSFYVYCSDGFCYHGAITYVSLT